MVLKGFSASGDLCSSVRWSTTRHAPLTQLASLGVTFDRIPMCGDDELDLETQNA